MFAPPGAGRPSLPATRMAAILALQALHDYSDRGTAEAVRFGVWWKVACGLAVDDHGFDASSLVFWRNRIARSERTHRVNDAVRKIVEETGGLAGPAAPRGGLHDPGGHGRGPGHRHPADQRHGVGPDGRRAWLATEIRRHQMPRWHEPAAGVHAVTPGGYSASRRDSDGRRVVCPVIAGLQAAPGRAVRPWHGWLGCHCNSGKPEEAIGR